jgi:hypothetical protein
MTTITLEEIKEKHSKLAEMIAAFEAQAKIASSFPITIEQPVAKNGEKWIGTIISADGSKRYHLFLLPEERESINWKDAMSWAKSIGGELPDRTESALLYSTMKAEFKEAWYWTREPHASDSGYAWGQYVSHGNRYYLSVYVIYRARAVRRLVIE